MPGAAPPRSSVWKLRTMQMPPRSAMEALLGVYFDKMHWFIWIFHEPTFMAQAQEILSSTSWRRQDMKRVLVVLTVAALGLKCAIQNTSPEGKRRLESISEDPPGLVEQLIGEVRLHLLELLDEACLESVQVTVLLGGFYIFHGSPGLAWSMIGMSVRSSYGLALHCTPDDEDENDVATQVRRRCWNHVTVADTFASQIYGRPASLDAAFSELLPLRQMDDTVIHGLPGVVENWTYHVGGSGVSDSENGPVSALTFHWLKYKLYEIIRETLSTFRLLRPRSPMTMEDLHSLINAVQRIDSRLAEWTRSLPSPFDKSSGIYSGDDDDDTPSVPSPFPRLFDPQASNSAGDEDPTLRRLRFQAWLLQDTYNAAVILAHRPLLEYRLSADYRRANLQKPVADLISRSFDVSVKAALRISKTPVMQFEHEFCLAFIFIHLFTAGVILCIPPTTHPHSNTAHEAKAGVFRIIQAAKALKAHSQLARHAEQLLSDLLKLSLYREVDMAFRDDAMGEPGPAAAAAEVQDPLPSSDRFEVAMGQPRSHASMAQQGAMASEHNVPTHIQGSGANRFAEDWADDSYLMNTDISYLETLDLPLDEAFGAFGQGQYHVWEEAHSSLELVLIMIIAIFNLMPDDPLNNWGWGRGLM